MGESRSAYQMADQVAELTTRVKEEQSDAFEQALDYAAAILSTADWRRQAYLAASAYDELLDSGLIAAANEDAPAAISDVLTAALFEANGVDYIATKVAIEPNDDGRYRVEFDSGEVSLSRTVDLTADD